MESKYEVFSTEFRYNYYSIPACASALPRWIENLRLKNLDFAIEVVSTDCCGKVSVLRYSFVTFWLAILYVHAWTTWLWSYHSFRCDGLAMSFCLDERWHSDYWLIIRCLRSLSELRLPCICDTRLQCWRRVALIQELMRHFVLLIANVWVFPCS